MSYYQESDEPALKDFYEKVWTPPSIKKSEQWFEWFFFQNPHRTNDLIPLLLGYEGNEIVGHLALRPTYFWINGQPQQTVFSIDLYLAPAHRKGTLFMRLMVKQASDFSIVLSTGQSRALRSSGEESNFKRWNKWGYWVAGNVNQWEKVFFDLNYLFDGIGRDPKRFVKRAGAMCYEAVSRIACPKPGNLTIKVQQTFDAGVDALWEKTKAQYQCITQRDRAVLNWRFARHPYVNYIILEAWGGASDYKGYLVVRMDGDTGVLVDVLTESSESEARRALIRYAEAYLKKMGAKRMACRCVFEQFEEDLKACGYLRTEFPNLIIVHSNPAGGLPPANQWVLTALDGDLDR
ncbi:MAG: hypothetical protein A4E65_01434 [Syntrophorhabdus sp. PtaU1.Bin153]|nr:MAG: hypothetical protein A4E65_01434 [Syntrophorhabdus sp. PtaU1.Bin153]